jgi:predicted transcriptional regulator
MTDKRLQIVVGVIALVALLFYTFVHTGGLLSRYVKPGIVGYICAFGIELAIVSLSIRIAELRKGNGQKPGFFIFVLVSVVLVSALANIAEGFNTREGVSLTLDTVGRLDVVQAVIGLAATGLISLIVLALSEIIGNDVSTVQAGRTPDITVSSPVSTSVQITERQLLLVDTLREHPQLSVSKMAEQVNVSRTTVYSDLGALQDAGVIAKNGDGYIVRQIEQ